MKSRVAAVFLAAALAACSGDPAAPHVARGNVLVNHGRREDALAEYREAARLAPKSAAPRERIGDTLYDLGRVDEALVAYREATQLDAASVTAHIGVARVLADQSDLAGARAELTAALQHAPTNLYVLLSRGNLARKAGDRKAALADFERAVHLDSANVPALFQYGLALLDDGQVEPAGRTFDRILEKSPDSPEGDYGRARYFAARGEGAFAAEALAAAGKHVQTEARRRLAERGMKAGELDDAVREATDRALVQMRTDPAFTRWANDPGFRRGAEWPLAAR